jgi:hypothetical protein
MIMAAMKVMVVLIRIIGCGDKDEEEDLVRWYAMITWWTYWGGLQLLMKMMETNI